MRAAGDSLFLNALPAGARRVSFDKGATVFRAGAATHSVYFVASGCVRLVRHGRAGEEVVLHLAHAGECFAEASLDSRRYHCDAVADRPTELLQVPAAALRERLDTDRLFARQWETMLARQLRATRARVERLSLKSAAERVCHLLVSEGRGTLKDLARDLGLAHEVLYRTLAGMVSEGRIERDGLTLRLVAEPQKAERRPSLPGGRP